MAAWTCVVVVCGFVTYASLSYSANKRLRDEGLEAIATITEIVNERRGRFPERRVDIEFVTRAGEQVRDSLEPDDFDGLGWIPSIGATVQVTYVPDDPTVAVLAHRGPRFDGAIGGFFFASIFALLAAFCFSELPVRIHRRGRRRDAYRRHLRKRERRRRRRR